MEGMGEMMKGMMGGAKTKELYPSLMDLPDLPLAKRLEVEQQAGERMRSGVALMNESLDYLLHATEQQNYTAMQAGTASLREGLARKIAGLVDQGCSRTNDLFGEIANRGLKQLLLFRELQIHGRRSIPAAGATRATGR